LSLHDALPICLFGQLQVDASKTLILAGPMGFEPTTSDVTGRRSNRAELRPRPNHPLLHFPARVATTHSLAESRKQCSFQASLYQAEAAPRLRGAGEGPISKFRPIERAMCKHSDVAF